jgi:stage II sporulation protein R
VLLQKGYSYGARASVRRERFPTRVYGEYVLERGEYLALIVELGKGEGDNWWCVVYPPLCFVGDSGAKLVYKSKIAEIIERWKKL